MSSDEIEDDTPKKPTKEKKEDTSLKVFLDRACYITSDGRCVQLGYIHLTEDLKEVEKSGGYYGTVRQALNAYVDRVLKGQPSKNMIQLMDLFHKVDKTIEGVVPVVTTAIGKKSVPPPAVDKALGAADMEAKRKRSKIVVGHKEKKLTPEQRGQLMRDVAQQFVATEIVSGLCWSDVPDLMASTIAEALYRAYDDKTPVPAFKKPVHQAVRDALASDYSK